VTIKIEATMRVVLILKYVILLLGKKVLVPNLEATRVVSFKTAIRVKKNLPEVKKKIMMISLASGEVSV